MTNLMAKVSTALSPEWDRWFDEEFTDLVSADDDLVRAEFDALIADTWNTTPPPPPAPADPGPAGGPPPASPRTPPLTPVPRRGSDHPTDTGGQRSPPG